MRNERWAVVDSGAVTRDKTIPILIALMLAGLSVDYGLHICNCQGFLARGFCAGGVGGAQALKFSAQMGVSLFISTLRGRVVVLIH